MISSCFEEYKSLVAMVVVQCIYAAMALLAKAAFTEGLSPMVFVVYRQAIATLLLAPITILAKGASQMALGMRSFCLVFVASLVGATLSQYLFYQGMKLGSSSMATTMSNLIPAITFLMAASVGLEKVTLRSFRSMAKVLGTIVCVGGAVSMAFFKGPKLLNMESETSTPKLHPLTEEWITGCLLLVASSFCWALWLILQVPMCKRGLDPLLSSAWMCFMSTFQSAILTYSLEPDLGSWKITSIFELFCCLFAGIFGSGVTFYLQSWSISIRGPLFSAMFDPLQAVIATILASLLLHEELHIGSLAGAVAVVGGLYIVLWGKAGDLDTECKQDPGVDSTEITIAIDGERRRVEDDMNEPLLAVKPHERFDNELRNKGSS